MLARDDKAETPRDDRSAVSVTMPLIALTFLFVAIGHILLQPNDVPATDETTAAVAAQPQTSPVRSDARLVSLQPPEQVRLTDVDHADLRNLMGVVLADFGYAVRANDKLLPLLVAALSEGRSYAYIDALLNTAAARGDFVPPHRLRMASGRMDTQKLLRAVMRRARG